MEGLINNYEQCNKKLKKASNSITFNQHSISRNKVQYVYLKGTDLKPKVERGTMKTKSRKQSLLWSFRSEFFPSRVLSQSGRQEQEGIALNTKFSSM